MTPESIGPLSLKVSDDRVRVSKVQGDKFMNTMTSRIITGLFVVVITSSMLGARAPDSEAEQAITTFYNRYLTKCGDSWYAEITFAIAEKGTPRLMNIRSLAVTLMPDKLHTVDALYGIEWRGRAILGAPFRESRFAHFLRGFKNCARVSGAKEVHHGRDSDPCQ